MIKYHNCKLGTIPARVQLRYAYKIRKGLRIVYREDVHGSKWSNGIITKVNSDGYFFIDKM